MSPWLERIVSEKLADALTYKTAKHHAIKPEPDLLHQVSENGSNLKLKLNLPAGELRVLKVCRISPFLLVSVDTVVDQSWPHPQIFGILTSAGSEFRPHSH